MICWSSIPSQHWSTVIVSAILAARYAHNLKVKSEWGRRHYALHGEAVRNRINARRRNNPSVHRRQNRAYAKTEHGKELARQSRLRNADREREWTRKWRAFNKEKTKEYARRCYHKHRLERIAKRADWEKRNKVREDAKALVHAKKRYHSDPLQRLRMFCLRTINKTITRQHTTLRSGQLLGCSYTEFKDHLEKHFSAGMTWDNYGIHGWHIDHRRPISSFDLTDENQIKACMHYTNLQPLWWKDNIAKSNKLVYG